MANDWHTALLPCYLKSIYKPAGSFINAKVLILQFISLASHSIYVDLNSIKLTFGGFYSEIGCNS